MTRSERLSARFAQITEAVAQVRGKDMAFAASAVAKLEAIEYMVLQSLRRMEEANCDSMREELLSDLHQEIKTILQSFHADICEHLALDQHAVIEASSSFKEIVDDICNQRG